MQAKRLTQATKEKIKQITSELIDIVEMGEDPKTAAVKLAQSYDLTKDQIRMVVRAYNTAASLAQMEETDKRAEAPNLIDAEEIIREVFNNKPREKRATFSKQASQPVSSDWFLPVRDVLRSPPPSTSTTIKFAMIDKPQKEAGITEAGITKVAAEKNFARTIHLLAQYFSNHGSIDPTIVEQNAVAAFGNESRIIIKTALETASLKKKPLYSKDPIFSEKKEPYNLIKQAIACCNSYKQAVEIEKLAEMESPRKKKLDLEDLRRPIYGTIFPELEPNRWQTIFPELDFRKKAALASVETITNVGRAIEDVLSTKDESTVKPKDVSMNIEATTLKVKSYIIFLMANDPVISKYPPDEVIKVYNSLSRLAPRAMQQPNLISMYLRVALQSGGVLDSFHTNSIVALNRELDRIATGTASSAFNLAESPEREDRVELSQG